MKTPDEHAKAHDGFFAAFPDLKPEVEASFSFGPEWVVVSTSGTATHRGDLGALKATQKKVNLTYAELAHLENGKITETWGYSNNLDLLAQLSACSPRPSPASRPRSTRALPMYPIPTMRPRKSRAGAVGAGDCLLRSEGGSLAELVRSHPRGERIPWFRGRGHGAGDEDVARR